MANYQYMMSADDVAKELDCSKSYAYKLVKAMNKELAEQGYITWQDGFQEHIGQKRCSDTSWLRLREEKKGMAYKEKDTKKWTAQWFETKQRAKRKNEEREDFPQKRKLWNMSDRKNSIAVEVWI